MTSIRAFSEILMDVDSLEEKDRAKYSGVIHDETLRLTRLLDDLLDLSVLENGQVRLNIQATNLQSVLDRAISAASSGEGPKLRIHRNRAAEDMVLVTDPDRLAQVFINLITNTRKYCDAEAPEMWISPRRNDGAVEIDFVDNGSGIPKRSQSIIFEKFSRLSDRNSAGGAGLGLAICREIMTNLDGAISYLPGQGGAAFRVRVGLDLSRAA